LVLLFVATGSQLFGQDASNRDKLSVFVGAGWAIRPSSSGFLGGRSPREDNFAITGGAEFTPFSHVGFAINLDHIRHKSTYFDGVNVVESSGETFVSGDAVFHILVRRRVNPFLTIGVARQSGSQAASGLNIGAGAALRLSRHVSLRPEWRSYWVHILSSDPTVLSMGIAYHW
jgi:hypothetical protein